MGKSDTYRLKIYEAFANEANAQNLKWVVLHGCEGYPDTIGRDLDIVCLDSDSTEKALYIFQLVAQNDPDTGWIIFPNPIWGNRVLATSKQFEVAELHDIGEITSGIIGCKVDFENIYFDHIFPINRDAALFKSVVMPLLGNNKKLINRFSDEEIKHMPKIIAKSFRELCANGKISLLSRISIYLKYWPGIGTAIKTFNKTIKRKRNAFKAETTPLVEIGDIKYDISELTEKLNEVFFEFVNGNSKSEKHLNYDRARQRLVFFQNNEIKCDVLISGENSVEDAVKILNAFKLFNKKYER